MRLCHYLPSSLMHPALLRHRRLRKHLANKPPLACRDTPWAKRQSKRGQITYAQCRPTCRGNIACQKAATKHALAETAAVLLDTRRQTDTPDSRNSGSIARIKRQTDTPWSQRQCCSPKGGRLTRQIAETAAVLLAKRRQTNTPDSKTAAALLAKRRRTDTP